MGPCMCGAWDCPQCFPELQRAVICNGCEAEIAKYDAEDWLEIEGDWYCPDCIAELERAAE